LEALNKAEKEKKAKAEAKKEEKAKGKGKAEGSRQLRQSLMRKAGGQWQARICFRGKTHPLGSSEGEEGARIEISLSASPL
jgi:hypothetical protein